MRSESVTVHKGGKEERYNIYVEDYVISYLKFQADTLEMSEIFFYGYYEGEQNKIVIYGAGKKKHLDIFDKYDLLEKVACRLTQAGPVFMVREKEDLYEVQGYDIFYHENTEMQNYMLACKQQSSFAENGYVHKKEKTQRAAEDKSIPQETGAAGSHLHYTLTLQLGVIFVVLVAIVINSTNSYDRMEQLNQSATEVFFALENQEAAAVDQSSENVFETADAEQISGDAAETADIEPLSEDAAEMADMEPLSGDVAEEADTGESGSYDKQEEQLTDADETQQATEALSRNVVRYYEIERGDTLYTICKEIYGDTSKVQQICDLNQIKDPDDIRYGQKIILP